MSSCLANNTPFLLAKVEISMAFKMGLTAKLCIQYVTFTEHLNLFINFIFPLTNDRVRFASPVDSAQATCYNRMELGIYPAFNIAVTLILQHSLKAVLCQSMNMDGMFKHL